MNERGTALVAALGLAMILLPLGAFVAWQARLDLQMQSSLRSEVEAFYVAEAGIEHAVAEIGVGTGFERMLAGPDGVPGTADDGVFPFAAGPPADFPSAPLHYDVRVQAQGERLIRLISQGGGVQGAAKVLEVLVARAPLMATPGALYVEGELGGLDVGEAGMLFSGFDHRDDDPAELPAGPQPPVPAVAGTQADAVQRVREQLSAAAAQRLVGAGGAPSIAVVPGLRLDATAQLWAGRAEAVEVAAAALPAAAALGSAGAPQLSVVDGDLVVAGTLQGAGVLVVRGALRVSGTLAYRGLLLALDGIVCEPASLVRLRGALWSAVRPNARLSFQGSGAVVYDSSALADSDRAFPGMLPHAAVVVGWQERL